MCVYSVCCEEIAFVVPNKLKPQPKVKGKRDVSDWCLYVYVRVCCVLCDAFIVPTKQGRSRELKVFVCVCAR